METIKANSNNIGTMAQNSGLQLGSYNFEMVYDMATIIEKTPKDAVFVEVKENEAWDVKVAQSLFQKSDIKKGLNLLQCLELGSSSTEMAIEILEKIKLESRKV